MLEFAAEAWLFDGAAAVFEAEEGVVSLVDFLPPVGGGPLGGPPGLPPVGGGPRGGPPTRFVVCLLTKT